MKVRSKIGKISGEISMPSSKSLLHRYLIMGSRNNNTELLVNHISKDVLTTIEILEKLGSHIEYNDSKIKMNFSSLSYPTSINFGESGSSYRFLLPYCFIEERTMAFKAEGRLPERPMKPMIDQLKCNDIVFSNDRLPFIAKGKISGGHFAFPGNQSSQFISGIMLIAPFLHRDVTIDIQGDLKSKSYVDITKSCMEEFGVTIEIDENYSKIFIAKSQYEDDKFVEVEGDWSNAIVPISLALTKGQVYIEGLREDSFQGDAGIIKVLRDMGADINWVDKRLLIKKSKLSSFNLNIEDNIDLFPVLSILAIACQGKSTFTNISRLRMKESDRIESTLALHKEIGSLAYVDGDNFIVEPSKLKDRAMVYSFNDHRIVMAAVVASSMMGSLEIEGFEAIEKSFPNFIETMTMLGAEIG